MSRPGIRYEIPTRSSHEISEPTEQWVKLSVRVSISSNPQRLSESPLRSIV
jgi:hypothetical protein